MFISQNAEGLQRGRGPRGQEEEEEEVRGHVPGWSELVHLSSAVLSCPLCVPCLSPCSYYAKLRQQELERERELAEKYRDRARERRDGVNKDYEETELISTTANYRAVGPTAEA